MTAATPGDAAGSHAGGGEDANVLGVAGDRQRAEQAAAHAAEAFREDALIDVLDAVDLVADGAGRGVVADRLEHRADVAGEAGEDGGEGKHDGRTGRAGNALKVAEGEDGRQSEPILREDLAPVEDPDDRRDDDADDEDRDEDEALGEQALAPELEEEGEEEGDRRQNQEDRLVGGENPARGDLARDETDGRDDRAGDDGRDEFTQPSEHAGEADDGLDRAADEDRAPHWRGSRRWR